METTLTARMHQWSLKRIERKMERIRTRLDLLHQKKEAHKITPAKYTQKKSRLDNRLRQLSARENTIRGAIARESRVTRLGRTAAR